MRSDSTLFVHFFAVSIILATGLVLGISVIEWAVVILSLTLVLSAEMFQHVLKSILESVGHHFNQPARRALRIGTAAVFVSMAGSVIVIGLIFARQVRALFFGM
jgi:diacylglycerol kinase